MPNSKKEGNRHALSVRDTGRKDGKVCSVCSGTGEIYELSRKKK